MPPDSARSEAVSRPGRAPTDMFLPTPLLYAPTLCPTPVQEYKVGGKKQYLEYKVIQSYQWVIGSVRLERVTAVFIAVEVLFCGL